MEDGVSVWKVSGKMVTRIRDRYRNQIELTDERWLHIVTYHPELADYRDEVVETIRKGVRRQDAVEQEKYRYVKKFSDLPLDYTHLVAVVKLTRNNFVLTAYGIEKKGRSQ
jgi:hypothetical protein